MNSNNYPVAQQLTIPEAIRQAYAHWSAGQAAQAEQLCLRVLQVVPHQPDVLHLLGVMAHAYGKLDLAIEHLRKACLSPTAPAIYNSNLAEMCRQKGLLAEAEQAAHRAVEQEPQLVGAWSNLGIILQESGKFDASLECLQHVVALEPANHQAHNNLANTYKLLGRLDQAQTSYLDALALRPDYAEAHSNLAFLLSDLGRFDEAIVSAEKAIEINPQLADAYSNLTQIEMSRMRYADARRWIEALLAFAPQHAGALTARAQLLIKGEHQEEALTCVRHALTLAPDSANAYNVLGRALQALGQHDEAMLAFDRAIALPGTVAEEASVARASLLMETGNKEEALAAFDRALALFPDSLMVMTARADSKTYRSGDPDIALMEAALEQSIKPAINEQMNLHFALGKAYLDTGNSERAFAHLDQGNALKRATYQFDVVKTGAWMKKIAATFTPELMEKFGNAGAASVRPVFVLGMPRSGTTLVEQILASHSGIHGAGELSALRHAVDRAGAFPDDVAGWKHDDFARIGQDYLSRVANLAPDALRLVDKMPANFLHAGLIPLILSGARIIHCRRDPVDTCLSCYSKLFAGEQLFAYRLDELGAFHLDYQTLMDSLRKVLPPDRFLEVDYENVVDDLEGEARRLIAFVDMPWEDACLNFHQTRRVVRTASVSQVRQPIYATSKGRWRRHAAYLGPLLNALGIRPSASDAP
ncbi:tetratricopeptide repeat-containing sulfotransferase family protein [Herbaspirillum sp. alder98]|uniref:tetratricopeptide repeat-containing sulfotransferase family protein n=1 Tax=Herbaspirillum sp. alder98 TaxID=2913096 RepID=UPI001CD882F7|nr:tetratricopeptide repeat-containing sulfotransferase family protein [Herbaspirillum sp. alder98]MCA1323391.1 tetratricopeptide repeat protein [Herbaspirillum sp. alder98]